MNNEIIVHLHGGLGHQLFQYAAALAVRKESNPSANLFFILGQGSPEKYALEFFDKGTIIKDIYDISATFGTYLQRNPYERWNPKFLPSNPVLYLDGYFHYLQALNEVLPELCDSIYKKLVLSIPHKLIVPNTFGFIHIRKGKYQSPLYYKTGMEMLQRANPILKNWLVFSDDIEWCRQQDMFRNKNITIVNEKDEYQTLYFMIQCKGGAILSNSTFGWWGAFMGAYAAGNRVVYPTKWSSSVPVYIFPEDWIGLW